MRKLILLSKKFASANRKKRFSKPKLVLLSSTAFISVFSCIHMGEQTSSAGGGIAYSQFFMFGAGSDSPLRLADEANQVIAEIPRASCETDTASPSLRVRFNHRSEFVELNAGKESPISKWITHQCLQPEVNGQLILNAESISQFRQKLAGELPFCEDLGAVLYDGSWAFTCSSAQTPSINTQLSDIKTLNKKFITRWKRIPYLISRRLELTRLLGKALNSDSLVSFCKILEFSSKEELPLSMQGNAREQLCSGQDAKLVGKVMLDGSIGELQALHKLSIETSKTGVLSVKIPNYGSSEFLLKLAPKPSTKEAILVSLPVQKDQIRKTASCFHPLYVSWEQKAKLVGLGLIAIKKVVSCAKQVTSAQQETYDLAGYISKSLSGETEFIVGNGRGKVLRLPKGEYSYELHRSPKSISESPESLGQGDIVWGKSKVAAIKKI